MQESSTDELSEDSDIAEDEEQREPTKLPEDQFYVERLVAQRKKVQLTLPVYIYIEI